MSKESELSTEAHLSFSTQSLIQRLSAGEALGDIAARHFAGDLAQTSEIAALNPADYSPDDLPNVLKELNAHRRRVGRLDNAIQGFLQAGANAWVAKQVEEVQTWQDFRRHIDDAQDAYQRYDEGNSYINFPKEFADFTMTIWALNYNGRLQAAAELDEADQQDENKPGWRTIAAHTRGHKHTAHAQMWNFMSELIPGFDDAVDAIRQESGPAAVEKLTEFARQETDFRKLPTKVMQLDLREKFRDKQSWSQLCDNPVPLMQDAAQSIADLTLGYAAWEHLVEEVRVADIVPRLLVHGVRRAADHTRFTKIDTPFNSSSSDSYKKDFHVWADSVVHPHEGDQEPGSCPVQHSFVGVEASGEEAPATGLDVVRAIQAYSRREHDVEPVFSELPTTAEVSIALALLAGSKPGGPLDPATGGLERIVSLIKKRGQAREAPSFEHLLA